MAWYLKYRHANPIFSSSYRARPSNHQPTTASAMSPDKAGSSGASSSQTARAAAATTTTVTA